ncbi:hypothetical protein BJY00DRAFT_286262 [Aspergillus carlsbadensis]|nr:hypothetical protein BJY00DRAFT_286262 [Aspergillus carlsbadensis]
MSQRTRRVISMQHLELHSTECGCLFLTIPLILIRQHHGVSLTRNSRSTRPNYARESPLVLMDGSSRQTLLSGMARSPFASMSLMESLMLRMPSS